MRSELGLVVVVLVSICVFQNPVLAQGEFHEDDRTTLSLSAGVDYSAGMKLHFSNNIGNISALSSTQTVILAPDGAGDQQNFANRTYTTGFVGTDSETPLDGLTSNYGITTPNTGPDSNNQFTLISNRVEQRLMTQFSELNLGNRSDDHEAISPYIGTRIMFGPNWGLVLEFSYMSLDENHNSGTVLVSRETSQQNINVVDTFTVPPGTTFPFQSSGTGPRIGNLPDARGVVIVSNDIISQEMFQTPIDQKVTGNLFVLGIYGRAQTDRIIILNGNSSIRFGLNFGPTVSFADAKLRTTIFDQTWSGSDSDVLFGFRVRGNMDFELLDNVYLTLGVGYDVNFDDFTISNSATQADYDLSRISGSLGLVFEF